jgi:hypothetical protein
MIKVKTIEELDSEIKTLENAKNILKMKENLTGSIKTKDDLPFEIGGQYFFRTITYFMLGKISGIKGRFIVLESASWIPDTGRFSKFINGEIKPDECEPINGRVIISVDAIVDAFDYPYNLCIGLI